MPARRLKKSLRRFVNKQVLNPFGWEIISRAAELDAKKQAQKQAQKLRAKELQLPLYKKLYDAETLAQKPFYNIGAGAFRHPYWTNLDLPSDSYTHMHQRSGAFIAYNIAEKKPLPICDNSAKIFYTSHTIEHVKQDSVLYLFHEVYRALEPGGIFRVTTGPDAETDYRALRNNDGEWFYWDLLCTKRNLYGRDFTGPPDARPLAERWLSHVATALAPHTKAPSTIKYHEKEILAKLDELGLQAALEFFTSQCPFNPDWPQSHVEWWTHDRVISYLQKAGFKTVYRSGYGQSASPLMRRCNLFDSTYPQISIYVEAVK